MDIGRPLTFNDAVKEVAAGRNVFTVTKILAEAVARAAGNGAKPMEHDKHENKVGYYKHYHTYKHKSNGHVWYLFNTRGLFYGFWE